MRPRSPPSPPQQNTSDLSDGAVEVAPGRRAPRRVARFGHRYFWLTHVARLGDHLRR